MEHECSKSVVWIVDGLPLRSELVASALKLAGYEVCQKRDLGDAISELTGGVQVQVRPSHLVVLHCSGLENIRQCADCLPGVPNDIKTLVVLDCEWPANSPAALEFLATTTNTALLSHNCTVGELMERLRDSCVGSENFVSGPARRLTPRETEIMTLVSAGNQNREIANLLGICTGTVKVHLLHIFDKYQVWNRMQAAARFRAMGGL